jgi:IPT/TIG domain
LYAWTLVVDGCNTGQIQYNGLTSAIGPTVTSFTPTSGPVGTSVTLTGTNLNPPTSVTFGGAVAGVSSSSPTQIVATVPPGAMTGPIVVTTPTGTYTSATNFTVTGIAHPRDVALRVGRKAKGKVTVDDGYSACAEDVLVRVQRREGGRWKLVGTDRTSDAGRFVVLGTSEPGRYRAVAKRATLASTDVCLKAVSPDHSALRRPRIPLG